MPSLDLSTITQLLKEEQNKGQGVIDEKLTKFAKPIQVGPVRYYDTTDRCASRGCGSTTCLKINGIPYCTTHSLHVLNQMFLDVEEFDYSDCSCNAGKHSKMQCHTHDCPVWNRVKEQSDDYNRNSIETARNAGSL